MKISAIRTVIISRTDAIGDVVLTLPMAALIKEILGKDVRVIFFGKTYTYPVIKCCDAIDEFLNYDTFIKLDNKGRMNFLKECNADAIIHVYPRKDISSAAKNADIRERIGTTNRYYHWLSCNRLVKLGRKNSDLHESQLNAILLKPFGYKNILPLEKVPSLYRMTNVEDLRNKYSILILKDKFKLVIHPHSHSSGREWKLSYYADLIRYLSPAKFQIFITGGEKEFATINEWAKTLPTHVLNLAGLMTLDDMVAFLNSCDGIVAASTGPLHIAAALGKHALGIYPPIRPLHPVRWSPVGIKAEYIVANKECSTCRNNPANCTCISDISPAMVEERIMKWVK